MDWVGTYYILVTSLLFLSASRVSTTAHGLVVLVPTADFEQDSPEVELIHQKLHISISLHIRT
jgi:hypothetical protein